MDLDQIEIVSEFNHLQIREITDDGGFHRRVLTPDMDVSQENQTIQRGSDKNDKPIMKTVREIAEELWTDEIKDNWDKFKKSKK